MDITQLDDDDHALFGKLFFDQTLSLNWEQTTELVSLFHDLTGHDYLRPDHTFQQTYKEVLEDYAILYTYWRNEQTHFFGYKYFLAWLQKADPVLIRSLIWREWIWIM